MAEQLELELHPPTPQLPQLWTPDDIYNSADQAVIELFREDSRVERKTCGIHARELGDYLAMYANTQPHGGVIFVGVENKGDGDLRRWKIVRDEFGRLHTVRGKEKPPALTKPVTAKALKAALARLVANPVDPVALAEAARLAG